MSGCLLCREPTKPVLNLGFTALANELRGSPNVAPDRFPLELVQCLGCGHLQLSRASLVPSERLYGPGYVYVSDTGESNRRHFQEYAAEMVERFSPRSVLDIGGNDGLFLSYFGCATLNVDPSTLPGTEGAPHLSCPFDDSLEPHHLGDVRPDLITANNVLAHNADLGPMLRGVKKLLAPQGVFVFEVAYAMPMLKDGLFDLIYHEHMHHWTLSAILNTHGNEGQQTGGWLKKFGLQVIDVKVMPTHGGSLRVYCMHAKRGRQGRPPEAVATLLAEEHRALGNLVASFPAKVESERRAAKRVVDNLRGRGGQLHVLGWPAKACTLVSHFWLGQDIQAVWDSNPNKIGRYTQFGQLIQPMGEFAMGRADKALILSWNYAEDIMKRWPDYAGQWLVPHPWRGA
jgi:SAM-dependent methyltransferase